MTITINGTTGIAGVDGSAGTPAVQGADTNTGIFYPAADTIGFAEGGAEVARFDSSGRLGIGTTSPAYVIDAAATSPRINVAAASTSFAGFRAANTSGNFQFVIDDSTGSSFLGTAYGRVIYSSGAYPLQFSTDATERARITSGGFFKAQGNSTYGSTSSNRHEFVTATGNEYILLLQSNATNGQQYGIVVATANDQNDATRTFIKCDGAATERFTARSNGGLANYSANNVNLASDERLKKDISPLETSWNKVKQIEVVNFRYKDCNEGDPLLYGVIAQQVQPIVPELVVVTQEAKEATEDKEATPEYFGIREQPMYWLAIKALQEAQLRIETLEAQNAAFEARLAALEAK